MFFAPRSIAFIGLSAVLLKKVDTDNIPTFSLKLIDPAHLVLKGAEEEGFYTDEQEFENYNLSNLLAVQSILTSLKKIPEKREQQKIKRDIYELQQQFSYR